MTGAIHLTTPAERTVAILLLSLVHMTARLVAVAGVSKEKFTASQKFRVERIILLISVHNRAHDGIKRGYHIFDVIIGQRSRVRGYETYAQKKAYENQQDLSHTYYILSNVDMTSPEHLYQQGEK